jgi:carboxyl-terminal processing protease
MVAVADFRYQDRMQDDQEFNWLLSDVEEFNLNKDKKEISLLETVRREELDEDEAKRKARKAAKESNGPLVEESDALAVVGEPIEATVDDEIDDAVGEDGEEEEAEDDDRPDLLLRESARIVADMIELGNDEPALARQFSLLGEDQGPESLN